MPFPCEDTMRYCVVPNCNLIPGCAASEIMREEAGDCACFRTECCLGSVSEAKTLPKRDLGWDDPGVASKEVAPGKRVEEAMVVDVAVGRRIFVAGSRSDLSCAIWTLLVVEDSVVSTSSMLDMRAAAASEASLVCVASIPVLPAFVLALDRREVADSMDRGKKLVTG